MNKSQEHAGDWINWGGLVGHAKPDYMEQIEAPDTEEIAPPKKTIDISRDVVDDMDLAGKMSAGEGSRGGHIIGHTGSGKPIYAHKGVEMASGRDEFGDFASTPHDAFGKKHEGFDHNDHQDAANKHYALKEKHRRIAHTAKGHFGHSSKKEKAKRGGMLPRDLPPEVKRDRDVYARHKAAEDYHAGMHRAHSSESQALKDHHWGTAPQAEKRRGQAAATRHAAAAAPHYDAVVDALGHEIKRTKKSLDPIEALNPLSKGGGGWTPVPGGKHGGKRRRHGAGWEYQYPTDAHRRKAALHHEAESEKHGEKATTARWSGDRKAMTRHHSLAKDHKHASSSALANYAVNTEASGGKVTITGGTSESSKKSPEADSGLGYSEKKLLANISEGGITANSLKFVFGGHSNAHAGFLKKLVSRGKLERRGNTYFLTGGSPKKYPKADSPHHGMHSGNFQDRAWKLTASEHLAAAKEHKDLERAHRDAQEAAIGEDDAADNGHHRAKRFHMNMAYTHEIYGQHKEADLPQIRSGGGPATSEKEAEHALTFTSKYMKKSLRGSREENAVMTKSLDPIDALNLLSKAGPFIGPKGGKWADAKHTIAWSPEGSRKEKREYHSNQLNHHMVLGPNEQSNILKDNAHDRAAAASLKDAQGAWDKQHGGKDPKGSKGRFGIGGHDPRPHSVQHGFEEYHASGSSRTIGKPGLPLGHAGNAAHRKTSRARDKEGRARAKEGTHVYAPNHHSSHSAHFDRERRRKDVKGDQKHHDALDHHGKMTGAHITAARLHDTKEDAQYRAKHAQLRGRINNARHEYGHGSDIHEDAESRLEEHEATLGKSKGYRESAKSLDPIEALAKSEGLIGKQHAVARRPATASRAVSAMNRRARARAAQHPTASLDGDSPSRGSGGGDVARRAAIADRAGSAVSRRLGASTARTVRRVTGATREPSASSVMSQVRGAKPVRPAGRMAERGATPTLSRPARRMAGRMSGKPFTLTGEMVAKMRGELSRNEISSQKNIPIDHASLPHVSVDADSTKGAGYFHEPPDSKEDKLQIGGDAVTMSGKMSGLDYAHMGRATRVGYQAHAMEAQMTDYAGRPVATPSWADPGFTPPTGAGPVPLQLSSKSAWMQDDLYAQPGIKRAKPELSLVQMVDDREDPAVTLRKAMTKRHNTLWGIQPAEMTVTTDIACPVHSRDVYKSMNLWNPMTPCTCPGKG